MPHRRFEAPLPNDDNKTRTIRVDIDKEASTVAISTYETGADGQLNVLVEPIEMPMSFPREMGNGSVIANIDEYGNTWRDLADWREVPEIEWPWSDRDHCCHRCGKKLEPDAAVELLLDREGGDTYHRPEDRLALAKSPSAEFFAFGRRCARIAVNVGPVADPFEWTYS